MQELVYKLQVEHHEHNVHSIYKRLRMRASFAESNSVLCVGNECLGPVFVSPQIDLSKSPQTSLDSTFAFVVLPDTDALSDDAAESRIAAGPTHYAGITELSNLVDVLAQNAAPDRVIDSRCSVLSVECTQLKYLKYLLTL